MTPQYEVRTKIGEVRWPPQESRVICSPVLGTTSLNEVAALAVKRIQSGDQRGLRDLYERVGPLALAVAAKVLHHSRDAEEVVQEAFLEIWRRGASYDARGSALAWVLAVVRSRAIDKLRSRRATGSAVAAASRDPIFTPALETAEARLERDRLMAALHTLSSEQQTALDLAYFHGLTHEEIAAHSREPLGTTKTRMRAAVIKLQDIFAAAGKNQS